MTMSGQMIDYDRYIQSLEKTPEVDIPRVKLDIQALIKYAEDKGLKPSQLTEDEAKSFVKPIS